MTGRQRILPVRRAYNRWVADETLEDFALRFTAKGARRWSAARVGQTALGAVSFLALEAIGGSVTLSFGFADSVAAILAVGVVLFVTGLPVSIYAARHGVDVDLLTRGAGFGYIGSTVTSLVYAAFTFILFAIEGSIMAGALHLAFGLPLAAGYLVSAVAVIPLVTHGISWISRFQLLTQPLWIGLNLLPVGFILWHDGPAVAAWARFGGLAAPAAGGLDLRGFGGAASVILALMPQIGEQVDVLRFLPARPAPGREGRAWWRSLLLAGPGWILFGVPKLLFGSLLAVLALRAGVDPAHAADPATMYRVAFGHVIASPVAAALLTAVFVVVSQLKINVMNAYAGSLAWSNFFSRLTHAHPGRVVWLLFNVAVALLLMELGVYAALERVLSLFAVVAVAWLGAVVADLAVNKPLGLSPPGIEFKRAHLHDVNPVGCGAMALATGAALVCAAGPFGASAAALAPFVALGTALAAAPLIALLTRGRFALARRPRAAWAGRASVTCSICEHPFEPEDVAHCPAYAGPICSLCCSLDARCGDLCRPRATALAQGMAALRALLPRRWASRVGRPAVSFAGRFLAGLAAIGLVLALIDAGAAAAGPEIRPLAERALLAAFAVLSIACGVLAWFFTLAGEGRRAAQDESARQTALLLAEIAAHRRTDAELQRAKEAAEAANSAKSRYVVGLSHELRTPLNAVLGYAQLLERDGDLPPARQNGVRVIRRSAEHLSGLIDGLLDVSKIEAGRLQIRSDRVRTAEFFAGLVDMVRLQAAAKGLEFRVSGLGDLPPAVRTDEKRLRQILINLLSNAIKFTPAGRVSLRVAYRNQVATLDVADSGPGIAPADRARVFDPFDRGPAERAEAVPGLGLGLTITRLLAELMGGEVAVLEPPDGVGALFRVRLMLAAAAEPALPPAPRAVAGYRGRRRTVMVVDDDAEQPVLMRAVLEPLGFAVLSARDGPTCLSMVADVEPDLFVLDVSMPGIDGWTLARTLRARGVEAPILMMSANLGEGPPPGEGADHDAALPKPFDLAGLIDRVGALLALDWVEGPPAPAAAPPPGPALSAADRAELRRLAAIGHARGVEARLAPLGDGPLAAALRERLRLFDLDGLARLLDGPGEPAP